MTSTADPMRARPASPKPVVSQEIAAAQPASVLLIRLKSLGDVVFTLPAVHAVRDHFPAAKIAFLVSQEHAPLLRGFAEVNEVIALDRALYRQKRLRSLCRETLRLVRRLRGEQFALAVDFQGYGETALLTWLSGAPRRWGSVYRPARRWAYTAALARDDRQHPADANLALLTRCGLRPGAVRNEFHLPPAELQAARGFFAEHHCDPSRPTLFFQPFTSSPQKNWPLEKFLVLARHWQSRGLQVLFGGGPAERELLEPARREGFPVSAGVPILTSAGLVGLSTLVVGGVTGLLHLAVAMQKRVAMLIGNAAQEPGFPYQHRDWAVSAGEAAPVAAIPVEAVIAATAGALTALGLGLSTARP